MLGLQSFHRLVLLDNIRNNQPKKNVRNLRLYPQWISIYQQHDAQAAQGTHVTDDILDDKMPVALQTLLHLEKSHGELELGGHHQYNEQPMRVKANGRGIGGRRIHAPSRSRQDIGMVRHASSQLYTAFQLPRCG